MEAHALELEEELLALHAAAVAAEVAATTTEVDLAVSDWNADLSAANAVVLHWQNWWLKRRI